MHLNACERCDHLPQNLLTRWPALCSFANALRPQRTYCRPGGDTVTMVVLAKQTVARTGKKSRSFNRSPTWIIAFRNCSRLIPSRRIRRNAGRPGWGVLCFSLVPPEKFLPNTGYIKTLSFQILSYRQRLVVLDNDRNVKQTARVSKTEISHSRTLSSVPSEGLIFVNWL